LNKERPLPPPSPKERGLAGITKSIPNNNSNIYYKRKALLHDDRVTPPWEGKGEGSI